MKKSVDVLIERDQFVSGMASAALIFLIIAFIVILVNELMFALPNLELVMSILFGAVMLMSLVAMIGATFRVVRWRHELVDAYMFLFIVWIIPYLGISIFLGWANLFRASKT